MHIKKTKRYNKYLLLGVCLLTANGLIYAQDLEFTEDPSCEQGLRYGADCAIFEEVSPYAVVGDSSGQSQDAALADVSELVSDPVVDAIFEETGVEEERHCYLMACRWNDVDPETGKKPYCPWEPAEPFIINWNVDGDVRKADSKPLTFEQCKRLDSCSGGGKLSGGGCYKWAINPSNTSPGAPW